MEIYEILILAIALAMDAFAVSICLGLDVAKATFKKGLIVGIYFGIFQALMPLIGYFLASFFAKQIASFDHWIAFILLSFLGIKMIIATFKKEKRNCHDKNCIAESCHDCEVFLNKKNQLGFKKMLILAIATSIDAMAVGITFALIQTDILIACTLIGIITFSFSLIGFKIGNFFGIKYQNVASFIGGIILFLIGLKILLEHLEILFW